MHLQDIKLCARSKKWWNRGLSAHLARLRASRRGGVGGARKEGDQEGWKRWRGEKARMNMMVREVKEGC